MRKLFVHRKPNSFGIDLRSSSFFPLTASLLFVGLLISLFVLPTGYTYDEICPRCKGEGTVVCRDCSGDGICRWCGGDGEMFEGWWCAPCQGSGKCSTCEGNGWYTYVECGSTGLLVHWMYNLIGATVVPSFISVLLFLGLFVLCYWVSDLYLSFNEWVYEVEDMGFWFNPSFMTWLFARHFRRWVKWTTGFSLILSVYLGAMLFGLLSLGQITLEKFLAGMLLTILVLSLFSWVFYKSYISRLAKRQ
jgi:hypothetical protein